MPHVVRSEGRFRLAASIVRCLNPTMLSCVALLSWQDFSWLWRGWATLSLRVRHYMEALPVTKVMDGIDSLRSSERAASLISYQRCI